ncbi:hypothetical protein [Clostridium carboxidivorans]|uniref:hypothetical protein n=1 Tax=Clostridium carboxidivorans TaxID=217159 RepID=UPI0002D96E42|nr:hypothetical protein [Clostridium carboxidivorans]
MKQIVQLAIMLLIINKKDKNMENTCLVPADVEKTTDGQYRRNKVKDGENK